MPTESSLGEISKGKNLVVCCDGTGNMFVDKSCSADSNSNVVKFYSTLRVANDQVAYYHPGVGTAGDPQARGKIDRWWSRIEGLAFGRGFRDNVLDAYRYLMETYDDGDRVFLIGFSRGAYTARALAGLLDGYGLLCRGNEGHLLYAWNAYADQHDKREYRRVHPNFRFKETFSRRKFRIHFLGIWDTVSSVGWINTPVRLFNVAQNPTVRIGRHAVSIDERRCFYRDNLWEPATKDQLAQVASEDDPEPTQDLLAAWFPGVHSDIGGSYPQSESGLSNHALEWLIYQAQQADEKHIRVGVQREPNIKPHMVQLVLGEEVNPMPDPVKEPDEVTRIKILRPLYPKPELTFVHKSLSGLWWLLELLPHRYYDKDDGAENWRTPLGMHRRLPSDKTRKPDGSLLNQQTYIHRTAVELMERGLYSPPNVVGGLASVKPMSVPDQPDGSLFLYDPPQDTKPVRNEALVRWSIMIAVTAADIAVACAIIEGVFFGIRALLRRL